MNRVEKTHLPVAALTHPGMKGKNNEDRFGVAAFRMSGASATPVLLAVLSDGIGGHRAGEVASELAVNTIHQVAEKSDGRSPQEILERAIHTASQLIFQQAQKNLEQQGMGATCACVWITGDRLYTVTVGDSRIYLIRGEEIQQLSTDHTWIQEALEHGLIEPDQVEGHPNAHVIRRYLGSPTPPEVDFRIRLGAGADQNDKQLVSNQGMRLQPGDILLLCSDGLTDLVTDEEIQAAFAEATLEEAGQKLIDLANERGGHDNITLIAIQIPAIGLDAAAGAVKKSPAKALSRSLLAGCLAVILLAVLVGGLAGGYFLYFGQEEPTVTPTLFIEATGTQDANLDTPTPTRTRRPTLTPSPFVTVTMTPTLRSGPTSTEGGPTITPWPTSTLTIRPTEPLPVVTIYP